MSFSIQTTTYHVLDLAALDRIQAWVMIYDNHAQIIEQVLGSEQTWMVAVTDYTAPEAIVTDRAARFVTQFGSAVKELDHA
jgi:hypothetical protein